MLAVENLHAGYGAIEVLKGITLEVNQGEIVTLIGANGAGKTTTLMTLSGIVPARSGSIRFLNEELIGIPSHKIVARGLVQSPEGRKIFPRLSVFENLEMGAFLRKDKSAIAKDLARVYELFPILSERKGQAGGTLSGGEQQMLAVGRALMAKPKLLVLDEPSLGLAPLIVKRIFEVIAELKREGVTILLVEQNARMALKLADRAYVLETGAITMQGSAAELSADARIQSAYLGEESV
jgi:branched-chain amino acid transport system ATP-binding protein